MLFSNNENSFRDLYSKIKTRFPFLCPLSVRGLVYRPWEGQIISSRVEIPQESTVNFPLPLESDFLGDAFTAERLLEIVDENCAYRNV